MILLGVNIDHVATVREARYRNARSFPQPEPDPLAAASAAEAGGASGITLHLRADRRHIQDEDLFRLRRSITTKLNLEMGNTPEILALALQALPDEVCLVPENRQEVTTEGGLDCVGTFAELAPTVEALRLAGIRVSLFVDPEEAQIRAASALQAECVELHTGPFTNARGATLALEWERLAAAAQVAQAMGLRVHAGHGLNYTNICQATRIPHVKEFNIGHSIVSRALFVGMEAAVHEMLRCIEKSAAAGKGAL